MGYCGGLGAGKGWFKFMFALTPEGFQRVLTLKALYVVITNARVPADYLFTPIEEYLLAYEKYVDCMTKDVKPPWKIVGPLRKGLATSLDIFSPTPCSDPAYRLMDPQEPVVNVAPVPVSYYDGKLSTSITSDICLGLELTFPKAISLDEDKHEFLYETTDFAAFSLFEHLKSTIKRMTCGCRIKSPSREHRTSIFISPDMKKLMRDHAGLRSLGLSIA